MAFFDFLRRPRRPAPRPRLGQMLRLGLVGALASVVEPAAARNPLLRVHLPQKTRLTMEFQLEPTSACYAHLAKVMGHRSRTLAWRNLDPYGQWQLPQPAGQNAHYTSHPYIIANAEKEAKPWPADAAFGLYLARDSRDAKDGQTYGRTLILTKGHLPNIAAGHLPCGYASPGSKVAPFAQRSPQARFTARLMRNGHKPQAFPQLPALNHHDAAAMTRGAVHRAVSSLAATFQLPAAQGWHLATYHREGRLIQVNYAVRFPDRERQLTMIGAYTDGTFTAQHLHFSR